MNAGLLVPRVPTAAVIIRLSVGATSGNPSDHSFGFRPAVSVASLRAARKHHLVRLTDPARCVVTDFSEEQAFTIADDCGIDQASIAMFRCGAHTLVALRDEATVVGLLSSENLEGSRIRRFLDDHPSHTLEEVRVRDLLVPCKELPALEWDTIQRARVRDLLYLVEATDCAYLLIVEAAGPKTMVLRGLLSRARLLRALEPSI